MAKYKYPQHPGRSGVRAFTMYGVALGLSLATLGLLWERFVWVVANPQPVTHAWPMDQPVASGWPAARPVTLVPSLQVAGFAAHLKGFPSLARLSDWVACRGSGKQPWRARYCEYHANDIEVRVGYDRDHGELRSVAFTRRYLNEAPPLAWNDLARVIPWVCPLVSAAQAADIAAQFAETYPARLWASRGGMTPQRPSDVGRREIRFDPHPQCHVVLAEQVDRDRNYSELYVLSIRPGPRAMRPENWVTTCMDDNRSNTPCSQ